MKKLFLILPLITTSIYASAELCKPALMPSKLELTPYIYQVLSSSDTNEIHKLQELQKLIGVAVTGWYRSYPEGLMHKQLTYVIGTIEAIIKVEDTDKEIYQMTVVSKGDGPKQFLFSRSYSPAFSSLETDSIPAFLPNNTLEENPLFHNIKSAEENTSLPFNLLSIGLDTPPEVAVYKNHLRLQRAVVFNGQNDPFYEFSNFYENAPIVVDGEIWPSVEHYFQAQKFVSNGRNTEHVMSIRAADSPAEAKKIGENRHPFHSDWEEVRDRVMLKALAAKFTQHKFLHTKLISTKEAPIIEHTEMDLYWGDGENGNGKSILGNLLMDLRDQFKNGMVFYRGALFPAAAVWGQLLSQIENLDSQDANNLARRIALSSISDIEKIDRMQMILNSGHFFQMSGYKNRTSSNEWIALINTKYPKDEDNDFRYKLIKIGVSVAGSRVVITNLDNLHFSNEQKIEIYKMMARQSADLFMKRFASFKT